MNAIHKPSIIQMKKSKKQRRYDLDWLRVIAIAILLFYHVGMIYVSWDWHINSAKSSRWMEIIMIFLHQWRMPLLFFISGAGTYFALSFRRSGVYVKERSKRLLVPVVFSMLVIVPPQIYLERLFKNIPGVAPVTDYLSYYPRVFQFIPYPAGDLSWHHLWFVLYLFFYSLIALPLFLYWRSERSKALRAFFFQLMSRKGGALLWLVPIALGQLLLRPYFPDDTHGLLDDWANFVFNFLFFVGGYVITSEEKIWPVLSQQRRLYLYTSLVLTVIFYWVYLTPAEQFPLPPIGVPYWGIIKTLLAWSTVMTTLAYGYTYIKQSHPWLRPLNEAIYPFYILHQTVIIIIAYYAVHWPISNEVGFVLVSTATFVICAAIYLLLIRPFKISRFLFGMKVK